MRGEGGVGPLEVRSVLVLSVFPPLCIPCQARRCARAAPLLSEAGFHLPPLLPLKFSGGAKARTQATLLEDLPVTHHSPLPLIITTHTMAAVIDLPFELPAAPSSFKAGSPSSISKLSSATLLPAGPSYIAHARRQLQQLDFAADDAQEEARLQALRDANVDVDELDNDIGEEPESAELLERDPKQWKVSVSSVPRQ